MATGDSEYIVKIISQFESVGLDNVVAKTVAAMREIQSQASTLTPGEIQARTQTVFGAAQSAIAPYKLSSNPAELAAFKAASKDLVQFANALTGANTGKRLLRSIDSRTGAGFDISGIASTLPQLSGLSSSQTRGFYDLVVRNKNFQDKADTLNVNPEAAFAASEKTYSAEEQAAIQKVLASSEAYAKALAESTLAQKQTEAGVGAVLAADNQYATVTATLALQRAEHQAAEAAILGADNRYATATAAIARSRVEHQASEAEILAADQRYLAATARAALNRDKQATAEAQALNNPDNLKQYGQRAAAQRALEIAQRNAALDSTNTASQIEASAALRYRDSFRQVRERAALAKIQDVNTPTGKATAEFEASTIAAEKARAEYIRASVARQQSTDQTYLTAKSESSIAERERAVRIRAGIAGIAAFDAAGNALPIAEVEAATVIKERIVAEQRAAAAANIAANTSAPLGAELAIAQRERIAAERAAAQASARAALASGEGTRLQRLQSRFSLAGGNPRSPLETSTAGQFFSQKFLTTAGYAIPSALLYGGVSALGTLVKQAQELEKIMNQLEAQFKSSDQAADFPKARSAILNIAKDTGVAADEVANTFFQFKGAFGDVDETIKQTESAMKIVQTTGLSLREVIDSLTAVSKTYADETTGVGYSLETLGNIALYIQESFGVASKETLTFVADLAAVGKEAGASVEELAGLGAVTQQLTARSGSALAESFGRVLPAIQDVQTEILNLYSAPNLSSGRKNILNSLAQGDTFEVFKQLLADQAAGNLSEGQKKYAISLLGSRREAQALIPVFNDAQKALDAMDDTAREAANPRLENYMNKLRGTVSNTVDRMKEAFKQLGQALFQAGLADALVVIASAAGALGTVLSGLVGIWNNLNRASGGFLSKLAVTLGLLKLTAAATAAWQARTTAQAATTTVATVATQANTVATEQNAAATAAQAAAKGAATATTGALTAATAANTFTTAGGAVVGAAAPAAPALAGAGIASLNPYVLGGVIALSVGSQILKPKYDQMRAESKKMEEKFSKQFQEYNESQLKEVSEESSSTWDRIKANVFGTDTREKVADKETNKRVVSDSLPGLKALLRADSKREQRVVQDFLEANSQGVNDALKKYLEDTGKEVYDTANIYGFSNNPILPGQIKDQVIEPGDLEKLYKDASEGEDLAGQIVNLLVEAAKKDPELKAILDQYQKDVEKNKRNAAIVQNLDLAKGRFEAGIGGRTEYLDALRTQLRSLQDQIDKGVPDTDGKIAKQIVDTEKEIRAAYEGRAKEVLDSTKLYREITGRGSAASSLQSSLDYLNTKLPKSAGGGDALTRQQKLDIVPDIYEQAQDVFIQEVIAIADPIERLRRLNAGFKLPPEVATLLQSTALRTTPKYERRADESQAALEAAQQEIAGRGDKSKIKDFNKYEEEAIKLAEKTGVSINEALDQIMTERLNQVLDLIAYYRSGRGGIGGYTKIPSLEAEVRALTGARDSFKPSSFGENLPIPDIMGKVSQENLDAATEYLNSGLELEKIKERNNPVRVAELDLEIAKRQRDQAKAAFEQDKSFENAQALIEAEIKVQEETGNLNDTRIDQLNQRIQANANLARSAISNNALATSQINVQEARDILANAPAGSVEASNAQANLNSAIQGQRESFLANLQSIVDLNIAVAQAAGDQVKVASLQLGGARDRLNALLASGAGVAEINSARADVVRAQAGLQQAFLATITSVVDVQIAVAEAAGDSIKVAELRLKNATTRLQAAQANGAGAAEQNALRAEVIRAEANVRNSKFNDQLGDIDYLLEIEKITVGQAIRMLQAMQKIPTNTEEMNRTLARKIKQLNDGLSTDLAMNISDEIKLPTLYEVRRANAESGNRNKEITGVLEGPRTQNYTDARIIEININESKDGPAMMAKLIEAIGGPARNGVSPPATSSFYI